jgi:hypothetical protein
MTLKMEGPGSAVQGATEANARQTWETSLADHAAREAAFLATHFWDNASHSVQPIRELRGALG